jgi:hypothetical protein
MVQGRRRDIQATWCVGYMLAQLPTACIDLEPLASANVYLVC